MSVVFVTAAFVAAGALTNAVTLPTARTFYFLISDDEHVVVGAYEARLLGGAGYVLTDRGDVYVAYAAYTNRTSSARALQSLRESGKTASVLSLNAVDVRLLGSDKVKNEVYRSAFSCLYAHVRLFERETARLADGATQRSIKRFLQTERKQFAYMERQYAESFSAFATLCDNAAEYIDGLLDDVVYAKDMRYLICFLCQEYARLTNEV